MHHAARKWARPQKNTLNTGRLFLYTFDMDSFKKLFGVSKDTIKSHCIISPLDEVQLLSGQAKPSRAHGDYFRVTDLGYATLIGTHYSLLVGDCVLSLADTPCRNIYLFGCAGGIGLEIGTPVVVRKALNFESFSEMLDKTSPARTALPDPGLTNEMLTAAGKRAAEGVCASVSSLMMEENYLGTFSGLGVNCLEMEASAVFNAARHAGKKACAALYISDRIPDKPWHEQLSSQDIARLSDSRKNIAAALTEFVRVKAIGQP